MLNRCFFAILLLFTLQVLAGAIYHDIDTRIVVSQGRVSKVIVPDAQISVHMEEDSGQIFVYALDDILNETTISIATDTGLVQDLEVSFTEKSSEIVCCVEESTRRLFSISSHLRDILNGVTPKSYVFFEGGCDVREICSGVFTEELAIFEGAADKLLI